MKRFIPAFVFFVLLGAAHLHSLGQQGLITGSSPGSGGGSSSASTSVSTTSLSGTLYWIGNSSVTHFFTQNAYSTICAVVSASTGMPYSVAYSTKDNSITITTAASYLAAIDATFVSASSGAVFDFSLRDQNGVEFPQFRFSKQISSGGYVNYGSAVAISSFVANQKLTPVVRSNTANSSVTVQAFSFSITSLGGATGATGPAGAAGANGTNGSNSLPLAEGATNYQQNFSTGSTFGNANSSVTAALIVGSSLTLTGAATNYATASITFEWDGQGAVLSDGTTYYRTVNYSGQIVAATLMADTTGSMVVDVLSGTFIAFPPITSITAAANPTISSDDVSQDTTLTGWTKGFNAGTVFGAYLKSCSVIKHATLTLWVKKN